MKFRNKETGKIREFEFVVITKGMAAEFAKYAHNAPVMVCRSIDQLNEEWEDYKPTNSLVKDKKIRNAVRAWAEVTGVPKVMIAHPNSNTTTLADISDPYNQISFSNERAFLPMGETYTIAELCGEEEE